MDSKTQQNSRFEAYGTLSALKADPIEQNGRYAAQAQSEKLILHDVISKLNLQPNVSLLDIGCGLGTLLVPCSYLVRHVTGIDHPKVIERLQNIFKRDHCKLIGCNFLDSGDLGVFDRIVTYSVMQVLPDEKTVMQFLDKALSHLSNAGLMLIGDISNVDKKQRFTNSARGAAFAAEWAKKMQAVPAQAPQAIPAPTDPAVEFNDDLVLKICAYARRKGYHAYILNQPQNLPFGNTREDILIVGPEYHDHTPQF